jgi:hypothetical protein
LTHIPIVVHYLIDGITALQQFRTMQRRRATDGRRRGCGLRFATAGAGGLLGFKGLYQLFQK